MNILLHPTSVDAKLMEMFTLAQCGCGAGAFSFRPRAPTHFILWKLLKTIPTSLCFTLCLHFLFFPGVRAAFYPVLRCVVSSRAKSSLGSSHMNIQYCRHNDKIITFHAIYYNAQLISIFYFVHYADYIRALCMLYVRCTQLTILFQTELSDVYFSPFFHQLLSIWQYRTRA